MAPPPAALRETMGAVRERGRELPRAFRKVIEIARSGRSDVVRDQAQCMPAIF
jgi:hypothetical protein